MVMLFLKKRTGTNSRGEFFFKNVPDWEYELHFSFVGIKDVSRKVKVDANKDLKLEVYMQMDINLQLQIFVSLNLHFPDDIFHTHKRKMKFVFPGRNIFKKEFAPGICPRPFF